MREDVQSRTGVLLGRRMRLFALALDRLFDNSFRGALLMIAQPPSRPYGQTPSIARSGDPKAKYEETMCALREGRPVILVDDWDREDEGDLIVATDRLTVETMALLIRECSGIVCLCLTGEVVDRLQLPPMTLHNESRFGTAFTVSIEARQGVTTGVSAADRVTTIRAAVSERAKPGDLVHPGHVFPLRAHRDGVLGRRGHTEGAVDLARLAGLRPSAVLCELMNPDGTMARGFEIDRFAAEHGLVVITIADVVQWQTIRTFVSEGV
jgi:3,4-dihydroxy 2-butanone 4-phosphate synthase